MTEAEWLACEDPQPMLGFLWETGSPARPGYRRLKLFAVACCARLPLLLTPDRETPLLSNATGFDPAVLWDMLSVAEREVDGTATVEEHVRAARRVASVARSLRHFAYEPSGPSTPGLHPAWYATIAVDRCFGSEVSFLDAHIQVASAWYHTAPQDGWTPVVAEDRANAAMADLLRDVVGNPFRPVAFDPDWRTTTAVQLARQVYESKDFSLMPILADALMDAGCDSDDVLTHCRQPEPPHIRGCWVVDLVLGKQ